MRIYIGIDPGIGGGIAFIPEYGTSWAIKMPETDLEILVQLNEARSIGDPVAMLEAVSAMPGQGVTSCFTFGEGYGKLQMALAASEIPYDRVRPQKWQKDLQCLTKGDKNVSKRKAQELFPSTKCTHAVSDALLIATYCKRHWK
jgi:hypothetical protein